MNTRRLSPTLHQPYTAARRQTYIVPLLTIDRAIADGISPQQLRQVAEANRKSANGKNARLERQAANLVTIADRLELLGYRSAA
ncbi:hypothetical protein G6L15_06585 [Agrobacterium rhizogenes]|uniref:hypothetical protein n=1 Tax=Rhizobium rhizogenes TaxID=359 RepID=UPI0015743AFA|nr:hypothetical protein [Rhizobium rhizogenes]NTG85815.1 hypothetical protein [Rhizobium rhizogenes]